MQSECPRICYLPATILSRQNIYIMYNRCIIYLYNIYRFETSSRIIFQRGIRYSVYKTTEADRRVTNILNITHIILYIGMVIVVYICI